MIQMLAKGLPMRAVVFALPLLFVATSAGAQPVQIPPAAADKVANALDAVADVLLDLKVGKLRAVVDGQPVSRADSELTLRDVERRKNPTFERDLHRHIAEARSMVHQTIDAINEELPAMQQRLRQASRAFDRAMSNMPDPTYPKR